MLPRALDPFPCESTSENMENVRSTVSHMSRTPSPRTESCLSASEHSSSEADGFSVNSGEDIDVVFSDPFRDDGVEALKSSSGTSANMGMRPQRSSSGSRTSSTGSTSSSILEEDIEAGYEADSDTRIAQRRTLAHRSRAKSRRASATVHYLIERVEPIIEVLAPMTPEELVYLKAHTNIPIPAHYEHLLPKDAAEASETPSSASSLTSETSPGRAGNLVGHGQPVATSVSQPFVAEGEQRPQRDTGDGSNNADVHPARLAGNSEVVIAETAAAPSTPTFGLGVAPLATPDHLPPTPDLRPWLAVASGEPSPMVLVSPAVPPVIHAPRPRLAHMASRR